MLFKLILLSQLYIIYGFTTIPTIRSTSYNPSIRNNKCLSKISMIDRKDILTKGLCTLSLPLINKINKVTAFTNDELNQINLYEKTAGSVCYINTEYKLPNNNFEKIPKGIGTGFVWDTKGHIITNFHVINNANNASVILKNKYGEDKEYKIKVTGADPDKDIAVIKINVQDSDNLELIPIKLGSNKDIKIGQNVFAIGNPFGQDFSFSMGIISGLHRKTTAPSGRKIPEMIQTDTSINPGNSGGPLIDTDGKLVGMCTSTMGIGVSSGVNFAVSIDTIKNSVTQIINYGSIKKAVLGISYLERRPSKSEAEESKLPYIKNGIIILDVPITSPCYSRGLLGIKNMPQKTLGDVIIGINDYIINESDDLLEALDHFKPNDKITLKILRGIEQIPLELDIILSEFNSKSFSSLENEFLEK